MTSSRRQGHPRLSRSPSQGSLQVAGPTPVLRASNVPKCPSGHMADNQGCQKSKKAPTQKIEAIIEKREEKRGSLGRTLHRGSQHTEHTGSREGQSHDQRQVRTPRRAGPVDREKALQQNKGFCTWPGERSQASERLQNSLQQEVPGGRQCLLNSEANDFQPRDLT